ncbi:MAG: hypothetical protein ACYCSO_09445 [Cuniculiplasma sp.]
MISQDNIINNEQPENHQRFSTGLAHWISVFGFAPVLSIPAFLWIISSGGYDKFGFTYDVAVALTFSFLLPSLFMYSFVKVGGISYDNRESRMTPLLFVAAVYFAGTLVLAVMMEPANAIILMFCYGTNTLAIYAINLKWKISVHAMGVAGPATALIFSFGIVGGMLGLLMLPIVWSRIYLFKHTPAQIVAGGLLGYLLTFTQFFLIETLIFHGIVDITMTIILIAILALPFITFASFRYPELFKYSFLLLILFSLFLAYLLMMFNMVKADYLLISNLALFMAMLFLPASANSKTRVIRSLSQC